MSAPWDLIERKTADEITGLSRQRRWQLRKVADGKCAICGKARTEKGTKDRCPKHAKLDRAQKAISRATKSKRSKRAA
jgi:hypothetical protein